MTGTEDDEPRFGAADVIEVASKLAADDATFLVGGQATNLWAWYYEGRDPALDPSFPMTSKDIDYVGTFKAAEALAAALGGTAHRPSKDTMNSPSTAFVVATLGGRKLEIDFLNALLGVSRRELEKGVSVLRAPAKVDGVEVFVNIPLLHPLLCLKSRVANMLSPATMRRDEIAWAQLHAAIAIVDAYVADTLEAGDWKEAKDCIQELIAYLKSDKHARRSDTELGVDLIDILRKLEDHKKLDPRYRDLTLRPATAKLAEKAAARAARKS